MNILAYFEAACREGRDGIARKTRPVDVRAAKTGEIITTVIKGEGKETQSSPAEAGDRVVRNRCPETGNEAYLVAAKTFAERYEGPLDRDRDGWHAYRPRGKDMRFIVVRAEEHAFTFTAPWGEAMVARPGDVIVQDPDNRIDTYRVQKASFACTYEIVVAPGTK